MGKSFAAFLRGILSAVVILVFVFAISSCQKKEGAMEEMGKTADEAIEATTDAAEDVGAKIGEGVEATKEAVEDAGQAVSEGAEKTVEAVEGAAEEVETAVTE